MTGGTHAEDGAARVAEAFRSAFGEPEVVVAGPGRVNLIGEHTDYNLGFVLPGAVDKCIWLALRARKDATCRFLAVDLGESFETGLDRLWPAESRWPNYLMGILAELGPRAMGVDCAFGGNIPIGSGMSSSAALECAFAYALNERFGLGLSGIELARMGQACENRFVGVNCGIMDPFASVMGRDGRLIRLDCRDLSHAYVPFERRDVRVVLCDTQVRRALATSEYNVRRTQCEAGAAELGRENPGVLSLRDATLEMLEEARPALGPVVFRRCAYVVRENARVLDACAALERNDLAAFGRLMNESHAGLRDDYQVSSAELDILAEEAQAIPGVLGSRMMGAGFGGCTINLVEEAALEEFQARMEGPYRHCLGKPPLIHVCRLTGGTRVVA